MANLFANLPIDMSVKSSWIGSVTSATATTISGTDGFHTGIYTGSFIYTDDSVYGVMTGYTEFWGSQLYAALSGVNLDAHQVYAALSAGSSLMSTALVGNDTITGSNGLDVLFGYDGDDTITGAGGNDTIDGGNGIDTAVFVGLREGYTVTNVLGTIKVADNTAGRDGSDALTNVEQARFADGTLVFDLQSSQDLLVYKIYQAAYGRTPDNAGFRYWAGVADANHTSALALADQFLAAPEFKAVYGANPTNTAYVTGLYTHVLGRAPDQAGLDYWVGQANAGQPKDQLLVNFATSAENAQLIGSHVSNGYWTT